MKDPLTMLADIDAVDLLNNQRQLSDSRLYEVLVVFGALTIAIIIATIWAVVYSKRKKKHRRHHHRHHQSYRSEPASPKGDSAESSEEGRSSRRKWKRVRRPHRPMNPTLAQTGGLPPMRGENDPLPPMP